MMDDIQLTFVDDDDTEPVNIDADATSSQAGETPYIPQSEMAHHPSQSEGVTCHTPDNIPEEENEKINVQDDLDAEEFLRQQVIKKVSLCSPLYCRKGKVGGIRYEARSCGRSSTDAYFVKPVK